MFRSVFNVKPNSIRHLSTEAVNSQWMPKKRVSRPTMEKIRALAATQPEVYDIVKLSKEFTLSTEAIRRILKSKFTPTQVEAVRQEKNRYQAMGERRKEFRVKYNIPEDKEKAFWKGDLSKQQQDPPRKTGNGTWTNDTYKKTSTLRSNQDKAPFEDRRRSFTREDDNERRSFRQSDNSRRSFGTNNSEEKYSFHKTQRPYNNREDTKERPFRAKNNEEKYFHNKQRPYSNREDTKERPLRKDDDRDRSFRKYDDRDRSFRVRNNEERSFRRNDDRNRLFNNDSNREGFSYKGFKP